MPSKFAIKLVIAESNLDVSGFYGNSPNSLLNSCIVYLSLRSSKTASESIVLSKDPARGFLGCKNTFVTVKNSIKVAITEKLFFIKLQSSSKIVNTE